MIDSFGLIAQILFALGTLAQAYKSYKEGHSEGVSLGLLWALVIGYALMFPYVMVKVGFDVILLGGYATQLVLVLVVGYYKYYPRPINTPSASLTKEEELLITQLIKADEEMDLMEQVLEEFEKSSGDSDEAGN